MVNLFFKLLIVHVIADYPLQGDFLSKAKNHLKPIPGIPFYQALFAHAAIQAGGVWLVTGSGKCAIAEFILHSLIDFMKSNGNLSFNQDQFLHITCKACFVIYLYF